MIGAPDIVRQDDEARAVLAGCPIVGQCGLETSVVLCRSPNPTSVWSIQLSSTSSAVLEVDIRIPEA